MGETKRDQEIGGKQMQDMADDSKPDNGRLLDPYASEGEWPIDERNRPSGGWHIDDMT